VSLSECVCVSFSVCGSLSQTVSLFQQKREMYREEDGPERDLYRVPSSVQPRTDK